jgi:hypothetical protein
MVNYKRRIQRIASIFEEPLKSYFERIFYIERKTNKIKVNLSHFRKEHKFYKDLRYKARQLAERKIKEENPNAKSYKLSDIRKKTDILYNEGLKDKDKGVIRISNDQIIENAKIFLIASSCYFLERKVKKPDLFWIRNFFKYIYNQEELLSKDDIFLNRDYVNAIAHIFHLFLGNNQFFDKELRGGDYSEIGKKAIELLKKYLKEPYLSKLEINQSRNRINWLNTEYNISYVRTLVKELKNN